MTRATDIETTWILIFIRGASDGDSRRSNPPAAEASGSATQYLWLARAEFSTYFWRK
jgi:hypothetical protein